MRRLEGIKLAIRDTTRRFDLCGREPMFSREMESKWIERGFGESDFVVIGSLFFSLCSKMKR